MERRVSLLAVIVSAACFSTLAILTTFAYRQGVRPFPLLTWRFGIVAAVLVAYQASRDSGKLVVGARDLGAYALMSLTGYGASAICFFLALEHTSASVVAVLLYTYPAIVVLLSRVLYGEPLTRARAAAIALTFVGCMLVVGAFSGGAAVTPAGVVLGLGAALCYALFNVVSQRMVAHRPRAVVSAYTFGLSAAMLAVLSLVAHDSLSVAAWSSRVWLIMGTIVLVPTLLGLLLYLRGIRSLGPAQAAIVSTTEPLFTIVLAAVFLGERLTLAQLAGAALVVLGVVVAERGGRDRDGAPAGALSVA